MQKVTSREKFLLGRFFFCLESFGELPSESHSNLAEYLDLGLKKKKKDRSF